MRYSKRYLTFAVIMGALLVPRISSAEIGNIQVSGFRGANLRAADWNPVIAGEMNKQNVKLSRVITMRVTLMLNLVMADMSPLK